jgi:hypothetical protein
MNGLHIAALQYANVGTPVFPSNGKGSPSFVDATTDKKQIHRWWSECPQANICVPTGRITRRFVIAVDPRHGGYTTLAALEAQHGPLPMPREARTPSGNRHLYFALPDGLEIPSSAGKLGPGLDVIAEGAYIPVPPSVHPETGEPYAWFSTRSLAPPPAWLLALLSELPHVKADDPNGARSDSEKIPETQTQPSTSLLAIQ